MRTILTRLVGTLDLCDILGILGLAVLTVGLVMLWVPVCPVVLGVLLIAVACRGASMKSS